LKTEKKNYLQKYFGDRIKWNIIWI